MEAAAATSSAAVAAWQQVWHAHGDDGQAPTIMVMRALRDDDDDDVKWWGVGVKTMSSGCGVVKAEATSSKSNGRDQRTCTENQFVTPIAQRCCSPKVP